MPSGDFRRDGGPGLGGRCRSGRYQGWPYRRRFVRRLALVLFVVLTLSAAGLRTLVEWLLQRAGLDLSRPGATAAVLTLMVTFAAAAFLFAFGMRRVGMPFGEIVAAADRVAS